MDVQSTVGLLLPGLTMLSFAPRASGQNSDVAVVVNSGNPVTNVSLGDLRRIFAGTKHSWPGGEAIKLVTRGPGCAERTTLLKLLAMSEIEYKQYWTAQIFRGEADAEPFTVPSVGMQKEALNLFPGAISLVKVMEIKPGMKVLKVDGLLPGDARNPLR
ncbi:MAG: substrate-binding domain-containing protein [Candidatus Sulfotelmatobacter sp.]